MSLKNPSCYLLAKDKRGLLKYNSVIIYFISIVEFGLAHKG